MVFLLASSVVAFRGWPQVAATPSAATTLVATPGRSHTSSPAGRRLAYVVEALRHPSSGGRSGGAAPAGSATQLGGVASASQQARVVGTGLTAQTGLSGRITATPTGPTGSSTPCSTCAAPSRLGPAVRNTSGTVGRTVTKTGQTLGSTVSGLINSIATKLTGVNNPLGSAVSNTGAAIGGTISKVSASAGGLVSGAGQVLGGVLSGVSRNG
jgi:hypothetical protein